MNAEGPVNWYLSVKYDRDPITGAVSAHQHLYIDKLLKKWGMEQCNPLPTPFPQKADDIVKELAQPVAIHDNKLVKEYQALVGSFLYLQVHTFPEISWAVSVLSKYMIRPGPTHLVIAKKLLRYLKGRKNITLRWCAQECTGPHKPGTIYGYADASFADTIPHRLISRIRLHAQRSCYFLARQ
jgi:predicted alternative tryptophan synthase beta-subunit